MAEILVTVTYGSRWKLLRKALTSAFRDGCSRAIVIVNGPSDVVPEAVLNQFGGRVQLIFQLENLGSAGGYAAGFEAARSCGAEYVLLLDDDNVMELGALPALRKAHAEASIETPIDNLILACFRSDDLSDLTAGKLDRKSRLPQNSFLSFNLGNMLSILWFRLRWLSSFKKAKASYSIPDRVERAIAPYGGMYFHRSLIDKHGIPNCQFVLYADDYEFSYRVTGSGGKIWLATKARLTDLEPSWNARNRFSSGLEALIRGDSKMRAFYNCRNYTYFEKRFTTNSRMVRWMNRCACLLFLWLLAVRYGALARYRLLLESIDDGETGQLGIHPNFPLP